MSLFSPWRDVDSAPFDQDLELAVMDEEGIHALIFPCRRTDGGWINAATGEGMRVAVQPTHWRKWEPSS